MNELNVLNEIKRKVQRRRYALKLNSGPFVRTLIASLVLLLAVTTFGGVAWASGELRVTTVDDLLACAAGEQLFDGPDAGRTAKAGDVCVVFPGVYDLAGAPVEVLVPNMTIRSRDGANVTVIDGFGADAVFMVEVPNVSIGGTGANEGFTITGAGDSGVWITDGFDNKGVPSTANLAITVQNNIILDNDGNGILVDFIDQRNVENFTFVNNIIRSNGGDGILFQDTVLSLGGSAVDERILIQGNTIEQNELDGVHFANAGDIDGLKVINNHVLRNADNGFFFDGTGGIGFGVSSVSDVIFQGNVIQQNGHLGEQIFTAGAGILFANAGKVENVQFVSNKDISGTRLQGITGNFGPGIAFDGAGKEAFLGPFWDGGVTDVSDIVFDDNIINDNGDGVETFNIGELGFFEGIIIYTGGDVENITWTRNIIRQNGGDGILIAPFGDFSKSLFQDNQILNNGAHPGCTDAIELTTTPSCNGVAVILDGDIDDISFENNVVSENFFNGAFIATETGDIDNVQFVGNNKFNKNGLRLPTDPFTSGNFPGGCGDGVELSAAGDISTILWSDSEAVENGCNGMLVDANAQTLGAFGLLVNLPDPNATISPGDVDDVTITNGSFLSNGNSGPMGAGNGVLIEGDKVTQVDVDPSKFNENDDNGLGINALDDLTRVTIKNSEFIGNDRNTDTVGSGIFLDTTQDMEEVLIENNRINNNQVGVYFKIKGQNGRELTVQNNPEINFNVADGILFDEADDLAQILVAGNTLDGNDFGVSFRSVDRGADISVTDNRIIGEQLASGRVSSVGIWLDGVEISITNNNIRGHLIGIVAMRAERNTINNNNIARNERFGIDGTGLGPNDHLDATNNWWGEPSGPKHPSNPGGIGDKVTDKVNYQPFLGEPVGATDASFDITEFTVPATAVAGEETTFRVKIVNNGSEEGVQSVTFKVFDGKTLVNSSSRTVTLDPQGNTTIDFGFTFVRGGEFTVEVSTGDDRQSKKITVTGPTGLTIEDVCDANDNSRIDDDEILTCIGFWVTGEEVPGTGQSINDAKILFLIELWVTNGDISTLPASAAKASNWLESVASFFAPAATVSQASSSAEVAPGGSFTVTTTIKANESLQGLLFNEQLPAGWTVSNVTTDGGFYKPSENKWLWLSAEGATTVSYTVNVPADAAAGTYTLNGALKTGAGFATASALRVRVSEPQVLSVNGVSFTGSRFVAQGSGITGMSVQVYSLGGSLAFSGQANGASLSFNGLSGNGQTLANGVYLYVVTVNGNNGQFVRTSVGKLMVLR